MREWAKDLNPKQLEAAEELYGPVLILAGAGSGKTKTMTARIGHMIEEGIPAGQILAITFTNKAADELKTRIANMLNISNKSDQMPTASTFHSFGYKLLRKYGYAIGYQKNPLICDDDDTEKILKELIEENYYKDLAIFNDKKRRECKKRIKDEAEFIALFISKAKDKLITPKNSHIRKLLNIEHWSDDNFEKFRNIYAKYEDYLRNNNLLDFDDLIEKTVFLLKIDKIRVQINKRYRYINVDEFQDTSKAQFEMVKLLAGKHRNICVVGDDYQSIYSFRGAVIANILNFPNHFEGCKKIILEYNYRSTEHIVKGASEVIKHNENQFEKNLKSARGEGEKIKIGCFYDGKKEAQYTVEKLKELKEDRDLKYSDFAFLYRKNINSRVIEEKILKENIPYVIFGGLGYYQRKEVKDIIAYLRLIAGFNDVNAFERVINFPARGFGKKSLEPLIGLIKNRDKDTSIMDVLEKEGSSNAKVDRFYKIIFNLQQQQALDPALFKDFIELVLEETGVKKFYKDFYDSALEKEDDKKIEQAAEKVANVEEFVNKAAEFAEDYVSDSIDPNVTILESFLEEISLYTDADKKKDSDSVKLMTMHKSKGLEFHTVFLVAQDENLPLVKVFDSDLDDFIMVEEQPTKEEIEEERRLFYVGMTRAKDLLYISCADTRYIYGEEKEVTPVRYINEIPKEHTEEILLEEWVRGYGLDDDSWDFDDEDFDDIDDDFDDEDETSKGITVTFRAYGSPQ